MGAIVFDNLVFDSWLTKKSDEILSKVDREKISTEEMIILLLKAQTNHFHHMDEEFRHEFRKIDRCFLRMDEEFRDEFKKIDRRFERMDEEFRHEFKRIDDRFDKVDQRFERQAKILMWLGALMVTLFSGLYLKLLL